MTTTKTEILARLEEMTRRNQAGIAKLTDKVELTAYADMVKDGIWTEALQKALNEHEIVVIPASETPYLIDNTVTVPSNRRIEATGAVIRLTEVRVLMLRNVNTQDGTHAPIPGGVRDCNISIEGGRWEESNRQRLGYGRTGMYDLDRSFYGVSTLMLFNNMDGLTMHNVTFAHTAGFSVQTGDITDAWFEHIRFDTCYADGLHLNGNSKNIICRDIRGYVGDDLVALNMYDWQNSSVNFGPTDTVLCDGLEFSPDSRCKAMRIEPGVYYYDDGSSVDCALTNAIIRDVKGTRNFKLYYQTPRYKLGTDPERGAVGSADNLYFEDIEADMRGENNFSKYEVALFELGSNIGNIRFENVDMKLPEGMNAERYSLITVGPKSMRHDDIEIFDPYLSNHVGLIELKNISVNGEKLTDVSEQVRLIEYNDINGDGHSTGKGTVGDIVLEK